jgi:conjugative transfer signal peptidase TraF
LLFLGALALVLLAASARHDPLLVWNASASSPRGLYVLASQAPATGDFVIAWPPAVAAGMAASRGYLPRGVPLLKTVAAGPGDHVCARGPYTRVNGMLAATRRRVDGAGRVLPWWSGCRVLRPGEVLLLGHGSPGSFDSRYFGPVPANRIVGRARLLWSA